MFWKGHLKKEKRMQKHLIILALIFLQISTFNTVQPRPRRRTQTTQQRKTAKRARREASLKKLRARSAKIENKRFREAKKRRLLYEIADLEIKLKPLAEQEKAYINEQRALQIEFDKLIGTTPPGSRKMRYVTESKAFKIARKRSKKIEIKLKKIQAKIRKFKEQTEMQNLRKRMAEEISEETIKFTYDNFNKAKRYIKTEAERIMNTSNREQSLKYLEDNLNKFESRIKRQIETDNNNLKILQYHVCDYHIYFLIRELRILD